MMAKLIILAIMLGLVCMGIEFYVTIAGNKTSWHRAAHLLSGLAYMGLAYVIWVIK